MQIQTMEGRPSPGSYLGTGFTDARVHALARRCASLVGPSTPIIADIVMAYVVIAYIVMADIVIAYIVMAYMVVAYVVMAYIVMAYSI